MTKGRWDNEASLLERLTQFLKDKINSYNHGHIIFLDTNVFINKEIQKKLQKNKIYHITDTIREELNNKGVKHNLPIKHITLQAILKDNPELCPVFYNFIGSINNPTIIGSEEFNTELILTSLHKHKTINEAEEKKYNELIQNKYKRMGNKDKRIPNELHEAEIKYIKKRRENIRNDNSHYINDSKNLSLSLIYALLYKKNVTMITCDQDYLVQIYNLIDSVLQNIQTRTSTLSEISKSGINELKSKKRVMIFLNQEKYFKENEQMKSDFYIEKLKKDYIKFEVKYFSLEKKKFYTIKFRFTNIMRRLFLQEHANFYCPFAKNSENGSWINMIKWWPATSIHNINILKISMFSKIINTKNIYNNNDLIHSSMCKNRHLDTKNMLEKFPNFY